MGIIEMDHIQLEDMLTRDGSLTSVKEVLQRLGSARYRVHPDTMENIKRMTPHGLEIYQVYRDGLVYRFEDPQSQAPVPDKIYVIREQESDEVHYVRVSGSNQGFSSNEGV